MLVANLGDSFSSGEGDPSHYREGTDDAALRVAFHSLNAIRASSGPPGVTVPDDGFGAVDLVDFDGGLELVERGADAVRGVLMGLADDGHARGLWALGFADGQRDDVDVQPAEERGDARERAGLVLNDGDEGVEHWGLSE